MDFLLDPRNPFLLTAVVPTAVLGALGLRKLAMLWLLAVLGWHLLRPAL